MQHLQQVSSISATHQSHCEELLGELEDSNRSYKASLKLVTVVPAYEWLYSAHCILHRRFSEGGNYCPEEVEQYTKKLVNHKLFEDNGCLRCADIMQNKLSSKVTSAKTVISNEVAVLAKSHCEAAWEVMKQFEAS